jgi:hypothetical protein
MKHPPQLKDQRHDNVLAGQGCYTPQGAMLNMYKEIEK